LQPATQNQAGQPPVAQSKPFTAHRRKHRISCSKADITVTPNRFGTNVFTVKVLDNTSGKPVTNVGVTIYTRMLDMDMGSDSVILQPDTKGKL